MSHDVAGDAGGVRLLIVILDLVVQVLMQVDTIILANVGFPTHVLFRSVTPTKIGISVHATHRLLFIPPYTVVHRVIFCPLSLV